MTQGILILQKRQAINIDQNPICSAMELARTLVLDRLRTLSISSLRGSLLNRGSLILSLYVLESE